MYCIVNNLTLFLDFVYLIYSYSYINLIFLIFFYFVLEYVDNIFSIGVLKMTDNDNATQNDKLASLFFFYVSMNHEYLSKPFVEFFRTKYNLNRHQMAAVVYLKDAKSLTMTQLSERMSISKQQASQLVKTLVAKKLVTRHIYEENRRVVFIEPSELAIQLLTEGESLFLKHAMKKIEQSIGNETEKFESAIRYLSDVIPKIDFSFKDDE